MIQIEKDLISEIKLSPLQAKVYLFVTTEGKKINGVYIGRGGNDMSTAVNIICGAIKKGLTSNSEIFQNLKLHICFLIH